MLAEGIEEDNEVNENQLSEPSAGFQMFSKEAKDIVFETDHSDEAAEAQRFLVVVQGYVVKKFNAMQAYHLPGWNDGNPEEITDDEGQEEDGDEDEAELMEDIKQHAAKLPTQRWEGQQPTSCVIV